MKMKSKCTIPPDLVTEFWPGIPIVEKEFRPGIPFVEKGPRVVEFVYHRGRMVELNEFLKSTVASQMIKENSLLCIDRFLDGNG